MNRWTNSFLIWRWKSSGLFVWFLKMYWSLCRVQPESFVCVSVFPSRHHCDSVTRVWYYFNCFVWQLVQTPIDFAPIPSGTNTHSCRDSPFLNVILTMPPPHPYFWRRCIDCVPREGLVFYITSDILLDPPVAPVSVWTLDDFSTTSTLVVALASGGMLALLCLNGLNTPILSH